MLRLAITSLLCAACGWAQSTQGLISGRVLNSVTGRAVAGASIAYTGLTLPAEGTAKSDAAGYYFLPLLSAGTYSLRTAADAYQTQQLQQLVLPVAGALQVDFKLRPLNDVWEAGQYRSVFLPGSRTIVNFYGPDVDASHSGSFEGQQGKRGTLDTSASYVITPSQIDALPLQGRDVYTMLVSLPGVTANGGTSRGLGISVSGARPSSSNYLLDGVENNNYLITGPLNPVVPEGVQEYRISTNNYSAEYGRTSGFVANAVTRAGTSELHGSGYWYLKNDALNAADFADNLSGLGRRSEKEHRVGYEAGGRVPRSRVYFFSALEQSMSHSKQDPQTFLMPTKNFIPTFEISSAKISRQLFEKYPGPSFTGPNLVGSYTTAPPVVVDRTLALERGDYVSRSGRDRIMARANIAGFTEPDFNWSPYPDFISPLHQHTTGVATNWTHTWTPRLTSELKLSFSNDDLRWDRAHPEVPTLVSTDGLTLPGSQLFYSYRNRNRSFEAIYSTVWTQGRHVITAGAGLLARFNDGHLTAGRDGEYIFNGLFAYAIDQPSVVYAATDRLSRTAVQPAYERSYRYDQSYFFAQDNFRISPRLTLNFGLRLERYGAPNNTGSSKDEQVVLGQGSNFTSRLASATLRTGGSQLFASRNNGWAPRFGFAWDPLGKGRTVVHGGAGLFYDRPFDNLWQNVRNNSVRLPAFNLTAPSVNYLQPAASVIASLPVPSGTESFPPLTLLDPELRNAYSQSYFAGVQHRVNDRLTVEVNGTATLGRALITSDIVNREFTTVVGAGRPNAALPDIAWRSNQGKSDYAGLGTLVRYTLGGLDLQGAWTWSHSIDNQSDPLTGDFFDLSFTRITSGAANSLRSSFARQYDGQSDRGNSDFDQRHSLFLAGTWTWRGWSVSALSAFRAGLPFSVRSVTSNPPFEGGVIENQRADLTGEFATNRSVAGGVLLLKSSAFREPADPAKIGNTGRNAFRGPGIYNADVSVSRSFRVPYLHEGTSLTLRADAFNILNHANLNNPDNLLGSPTFGVASYGRRDSASGFPAVTPVNETARQLQLMLRLRF